jgi:pimeloyl-ACP methyl ester carboxylesterase
MRPIIVRLLAEGYRVVALDLPGHGASEGRSLNMATAVAAVGEAVLWLGPFRAIVGHSFGGAVALNAVSGSVRGVAPVLADRLVLISAPSSLPSLFEDFAAFLRLGPRTQTVLVERVGHITGRVLEDFVGAEQLRRLSVPTLVVHAPDDKEVAFANALAFAKAGRHVTLARADGLGHRRIISDERALDEMAWFVATGRTSARQPIRDLATRQAGLNGQERPAKTITFP